MLDRDSRHALELPAEVGESDESWLTSYLDVLTLLITLFVLLLALTHPAVAKGVKAVSWIPRMPLRHCHWLA